MTTPLNVLIVEDSESDALLLVRELKKCAFEPSFERVDDAVGMASALKARTWDIITCDYSMPPFDGMGALRVLAESGLDTPLIIISGTIGEETAVAALHAGAADFLIKDNLARLRPAIERAMRESASRIARRQAEAALGASELRFRSLWESGIVGICVADGAGRLHEANDTFLEMIGYPRECQGVLTWAELAPAGLMGANTLLMSDIRAHGSARPREMAYVRKDGSHVPALVAAANVAGSRTIFISLDLSERKRLEEQIRQAQKLEAVGRVVGGVAHEFNNLLSVVLSYTDMVISTLRPDDPLCADMTEIRTAGHHAASLTRQLLSFGRNQVLQPRVLDVNQVIGGMERMTARLLGASHKLVLVPAVDLAPVKADQGQLEQVVLNLAVNGRDAMPHGGGLTIETANVELDVDYTREHPGVEPGHYVMLSVTDTGEGMGSATQARIFEPFFTTKEKGKGTGLGLWVVFGIVEQYGGHVTVHSQPGTGTTFKVFLPRAHGSVEAAPAAEQLTAAAGGSETILLVEDEDQVRAVARAILRRAGYHVLEAPNGGEALLICEKHSGQIDLLLTDVVLPHMSGRELAERITPLRPATKVLLMSGYTEDVSVHDGVLHSEVAFLQKPFTPEALARKVREILGATRTAPALERS